MTKKGTFIVRIISQENATWQGKVTWAEREETATFRSMLELIRLMDGAMERTNGTCQPVQEMEEQADIPPEAV